MNLGTSEIMFRKKLLVVTNYQMAILLLFNKMETLRVSDIITYTEMAEGQLDSHLLALSNKGILKRTGEGEKLDPKEEFTPNMAWEDKLKKVSCIPTGKVKV